MSKEEQLITQLEMARAERDAVTKRMIELMRSCHKAAEILREIEWIGSGAKAKIEEAIALMMGEEEDG